MVGNCTRTIWADSCASESGRGLEHGSRRNRETAKVHVSTCWPTASRKKVLFERFRTQTKAGLNNYQWQKHKASLLEVLTCLHCGGQYKKQGLTNHVKSAGETLAKPSAGDGRTNVIKTPHTERCINTFMYMYVPTWIICLEGLRGESSLSLAHTQATMEDGRVPFFFKDEGSGRQQQPLNLVRQSELSEDHSRD